MNKDVSKSVAGWLAVLMLALLAVALTSCTSNAAKLARTSAATDERVKELVQGGRIANDATKEQAAALDRIAAGLKADLAGRSNTWASLTNATAATRRASVVAGDQLRRVAALVGEPAKDQGEFIRALLEDNEALRQDALRRDIERQSQETAWLGQRRELEAKLLKYGELYEAERNRSTVKRFWAWAVGSFGLIGAIVFMVMCPAVALPLVGRLLAWLVGVMPAISDFLGVVSAKAFGAVVSGVEKLKESVDASTKLKIETELRGTMDETHKSAVRIARAKHAAKKISKG